MYKYRGLYKINGEALHDDSVYFFFFLDDRVDIQTY
jgi:hypothetical protein